MATLTRLQNLISSRRTSPASQTSVLDTHVPSPFPSLRDRHEQTGERLSTDSRIQPNRAKNLPPAPALTIEPAEQITEAPRDAEILPSLMSVEQSCLMALNNLFAGVIASENWRPIVPPRRHSLPSLVASTSQAISLADSTPLYTLVSNLRFQNDGDVMIEASDNDADLLRELGQHVELYSPLMGEKDARLARLLVDLLQYSGKLSPMTPTSSLLPPGLVHSTSQTLSASEVYDTLSRQASSIQLQLQDSLPNGTQNRSVSAAQQAMLWAQVDHTLGDILALCHDRALPTPFLSPYQSEDYDKNLPPEYDQGDYHIHPPVYETPLQPYSDFAPEKEKAFDSQSVHQGASSHRESIVSSEKMKLDLDSVMMAIDRLYIVAPQLNSQRVELKGRKLEQMEFARVAGAIEKLVDSGRLDDQRAVYRPNAAQIKGKQRLEDQRDLDNLMSMIGQAASRTLDSQTVYVDDMQARLARAKQKDDAKRDAFVTQLAQHSSHGRLHSQDATLRALPKERSTALRSELDLRNTISRGTSVEQDTTDPNAMMTLPEFIKSHSGPNRKSPPPAAGSSHPGSPKLLKKSSKLNLQGRNRSNSAPPLAWLTGKSAAPRSSPAVPPLPPAAQMGITYVAEHRESLHMVSLQLRVDGLPRSAKFEGEVLTGPDQSNLVLQCGSTTLSPLPLPARVPAGRVDLFAASMGRPMVASDYLDLKLTTSPAEGVEELHHDHAPLLDAEQLRACRPSSFVCASCSLPVVNATTSGTTRYNDLPSEHWAELLDAWMCHPDQQVSAEIAKRAEGFWPTSGEVLVGGGYLLFDSSVVNQSGLVDAADQTDPFNTGRAIKNGAACSVCVGRRSDIVKAGKKARCTDSESTPYDRLWRLKDMVDLAQAHASYRFIVQDEESGVTRILIWLFKPSIQLSYAGAAGSVIPARGSITAAKVTFVIFGPSEPANSLERYPAFRNAEILSYPMDLCRRLAASLKESNAVYPEARRTLDGLSLGWLQRA
ncbi:hypothetical protein FRC07_000684 [Ceratobasidium sp. 392]|nr:hypothetical protein FRC07_000684 [Ceratobasidium sp. 392]